ncbi:MAG: hypothetical protein L0I76_36515 [Pseudonocardia sp.]|nr:hypothetical protein [Pseudonocardia sp.]
MSWCTDDLEADLTAIAGSFGALADTDVSNDRGDGQRGEHLELIAAR